MLLPLDGLHLEIFFLKQFVIRTRTGKIVYHVQIFFGDALYVKVMNVILVIHNGNSKL